jgi:hypothetical protein
METIFAGGEERQLCLKPRTMPVGDPRCCTGVVGVGISPPLIDRKDWPACVDLTVGATEEITNQSTTSLCHSFSGTGVNQDARALAGHDPVQLSAGYLAGLVTGHRNEGAGIDEVLQILLKFGQCKRSTVGQMDYGGRDWPELANDEALEYRPLDVWDCGHDDVFDALMSAVIDGNPGHLGTYAFGGGHAVEMLGYFLLNGVVYPFGKNSWGSWTNWSQKMLDIFAGLCPFPDKSKLLLARGSGYWMFPERQLCNGLDMFGAWAFQSARINKDDS